MTGLLHAHSGLRWVVLVLMILAIIKAFKGAKNNSEYLKGDDKIFLFAMIAFHTQVLLGLILYFGNGWYQIDGEVMANPATRFFAVEHSIGMLVGMALVTIGRVKSKKIEDVQGKYKKIATLYLLALIVALVSIPWPFMAAGRGLF